MEYLKNNAILQCSCGTVPATLRVTSNSKIKARDGLFATNKDNKGVINVPTFGICAYGGSPCVLTGVILNWINTVSKVTIMGCKPLTDKSKLICPKGGIISCLISGQI
ncbi:DUF4280 domain-containing protein [Bacteroides congonensis]